MLINLLIQLFLVFFCFEDMGEFESQIMFLVKIIQVYSIFSILSSPWPEVAQYKPQVLMSRNHFNGQRWVAWSSPPPLSVRLVYVVLMLRLKINTHHFGKQIWLGKLLKYLKSGLLKLLRRSTLRRKLYAVRGRNCISVLMPVSAVCCCHLLPPGCRCWCHSAGWHGSVVGISADGLWQEWAHEGKRFFFFFFNTGDLVANP